VYAAEQSAPKRGLLSQAVDEEARLQDRFFQKNGGTESVAVLREEMQKIMEQSAGIYRSGETLAAAASKLAQLQERFGQIRLDDHGHIFNTELTAALELACMLDIAECMVHCALQRTESRGAHQRTDYPARDDKNFLAHSLVERGEDGRPMVEYVPVKLTNWPPGERVYGRAAHGKQDHAGSDAVSSGARSRAVDRGV
jgi:fumarate reductase flavoprotein subunit